MLGLDKQITRVVGQRHLVLTLERLRAGVSLIVTRAIAPIAQPVGKIGFGGLDLAAQPNDLGLEFVLDRLEFGIGPRVVDHNRRRRLHGQLLRSHCGFGGCGLCRCGFGG